MTESIEWGACPVCGGRVAGEVDGWRSDGTHGAADGKTDGKEL